MREEVASKYEHTSEKNTWTLQTLQTLRLPGGSTCRSLARIATAAGEHFRSICPAPPAISERQQQLTAELLESQLFALLEDRWVAVER